MVEAHHENIRLNLGVEKILMQFEMSNPSPLSAANHRLLFLLFRQKFGTMSKIRKYS